MHRILLSCNSVDDANFLKNYLESELPYEVVLASSHKEIPGLLKGKTVHLLMMQTGQLAKLDIQYALGLRQDGFNYPMMIITDSLGDLRIEEISEKQRIYFLERPFELRTFKGLTKKLMIAKSVPQQVYRRFRTNISATLETFISGEKYETHMFNLSKGGAYFEMTKRPAVGVGDLLRLKVQSADLEREHQIHGRIIWTTHKGHAAGGYGLGVKFMKSTDIYRSLLDKV